MRTLLCVSDFPYSTPTVKFGGLIVELLKSEVRVMTVRSTSEDPAMADSVLDQAMGFLPIIPSVRVICQGLPEDQILETLLHHQFDLVVVGASQHSNLGKLFFGLVTQRLVSHTDVSVLVVSYPRIRLKKILLATAGHEASDPTVMAGAKLAQLSKAEVTLVHVAGVWPGMYAGLSRMEETLPELLQVDTPLSRHLKDDIALLRSQGINSQLELRHGLPAEEILRSANKHDFDLMVIGASKPRGLHRFILDDVAPQIVEKAPCPVLVVRGELDE